MQPDKKIYHYYHAYADGKDSIPVVKEHLNNLISSNLSKYLERFYIGIVGSDTNRKKIKDLFLYFEKEIPFDILFEEYQGYEQITLEKIREHSQHHEGYYFYAHSKSSSNNHKSNKCWMRTMEIYNLLQWEKVVPRLNSFEAVGCFWMTYKKFPNHVHWNDVNNDTNSFFAGNYWWTTSNVIKNLPKPDTANRYMAEQWVGNKLDLKVYDLRAGLPRSKNFKCGKGIFSCRCKGKLIIKKGGIIIFLISMQVIAYLIALGIFN